MRKRGCCDLNSAVNSFPQRDPDFLASIDIYPCGPETRSVPPFNGIRWNFIFAQSLANDGLSDAMRQMIFPEFVDNNGDQIADKIPLIGKYDAKMYIIAISNDAPAITVGTKFYCAEGSRIVAEGIVMSLDL